MHHWMSFEGQMAPNLMPATSRFLSRLRPVCEAFRVGVSDLEKDLPSQSYCRNGMNTKKNHEDINWSHHQTQQIVPDTKKSWPFQTWLPWHPCKCANEAGSRSHVQRPAPYNAAPWRWASQRPLRTLLGGVLKGSVRWAHSNLSMHIRK